METPLILMDRARIQRSAKRMGYEILEMNSSNKPLFLFGIDERGYAVAKLLSDIFSDISNLAIETVQLAVNKKVSEKEFANLSGKDIEGKIPVIVDDVIFSGETMFRALKKISDAVDPSEIHTAVLIDRGHRKWPVKAEFCGMELPTKHNEHVSVSVNDMDVTAIELEKVQL